MTHTQTPPFARPSTARLGLLLLLFLLVSCGERTARQHYRDALALAADGDAPQALEHFRRAADHAQSDTLLAAISSDMGQLLFQEGLQEDALAAFRRAYEADRRQNDTLAMAVDLRDMGNVCRTREADDSCLVYFGEALQLARAADDAELATDIELQLAGYHLWHGHYDEARRLLLPALQAMPDNAGLQFMAADLYRHTGPRDSALHYCELLVAPAPVEAGQSSAIVHRQMGHKWLAELLLQAGQTREALHHLEQYELLTDTLQQDIDTEALRRTNALYDYSRRERQNARLKLRLAVAISAAVALAALLAAAAFWFARRRMHYRLKLQQLEQLLADRRRRDTETADRQQLILTQTPIYKRITQLLGDAQPKPLTDEEWHILSDTIEKTHPQFHRRLAEFQRLSAQEMRISLLVKLGIGPADIARLTARSKQSVSSTRSRLYEKAFGQKASPAQWDEFILSL